MEQEELLLLNIKEQVNSISKQLDDRVALLERYKLITDVDKEKMYVSARASAEAVLRAVYNEKYPLDMRRELASRLLEQFKISVEKVLRDAESKAFSKKFLERSLVQAEISAAAEVDALDWYQRNSRIFKNMRQSTIKRLYSQRQRSSIEMIEKEVAIYKDRVREMILMYTTKQITENGQTVIDKAPQPSHVFRNRLYQKIKNLVGMIKKE